MNQITCTELINIFDRIGGKLVINYLKNTCTYDDHICVNIETDDWLEIDELLYSNRLFYKQMATEIKAKYGIVVDKVHKFQDTSISQLILQCKRDQYGKIL